MILSESMGNLEQVATLHIDLVIFLEKTYLKTFLVGLSLVHQVYAQDHFVEVLNVINQ